MAVFDESLPSSRLGLDEVGQGDLHRHLRICELKELLLRPRQVVQPHLFCLDGASVLDEWLDRLLADKGQRVASRIPGTNEVRYAIAVSPQPLDMIRFLVSERVPHAVRPFSRVDD